MSVWLAGGYGNVHYFRQSTEQPPRYDKTDQRKKHRFLRITVIVEMSVIASVLQGVVSLTDKCDDNLQMSNSLA